MKKLKKKFHEDEKKLIYTMIYVIFFNIFIMIFHNFKTVYLQLFTQVKTSMEYFENKEYNDIIKYIDEHNVVKNEILYLIIYNYVMDIMYQNIKSALLIMDHILYLNINYFSIFLFIVLLFLIISINLVYFRNVNKDCKKFIHISKIFKVCNTNI